MNEMHATYRIAAVVELVTKRYLETGDDSSISDIADMCHRSQSWVRKVFDTARGCPEGLTTYLESRTSYSKNYPGMESGVHQVRMYGPSRQRLRSLLVAAGRDVAAMNTVRILQERNRVLEARAPKGDFTHPSSDEQ
jgi:hypothetical protein